MKKPFAQLAIAAVQLLDNLLVKEKTGGFIVLLEKNVKSAVSSLVLFMLLTSAIIIPNLLIFFSPINQIYYHPTVFYLMGSVLPFIYVAYFQKQSSDYNFLSQLLHRLVLNHYHLGFWLLSRQIRNTTNESVHNQKSVIITGLARSGTTALTKTLHKNGNFSSLDYSNMPFLLYPRLWKFFYNPKNKEDKERAHKDGVKVGLSSVEALEEYFFKVISNDSYVTEEGLIPNKMDDASWHLYKRYQTSIAKGQPYLAKNNNHILRMHNLNQDNNATIFVLFREPLEHAESLLNQHKSFCLEQQKDSFILEYMNWLGHYEFGLNQKPFLLSNRQSNSEFGPDCLEYWIAQWINYYSYALGFDKVTLLSYQQFLQDPKSTISIISKYAGVAINTDNLESFTKKKKEISCKNETLTKQAQDLYQILLKKSYIDIN